MKMRKLFLLLVAITAVWLHGQAQVFYEQWLDGNRASIQRGNLILGEQTIMVDMASMPYPGLHFLNILPYDESGEPGVWQSIAFLMPECWPGTNEATQVEYWVTGYDSKPKREAYAGTAVTFDIDASHFSPGLHFLNYRTLNERGEGGAWHIIPFLMPEYWPGTNDVKQIEYWVAGYDDKPKRMEYTGSEIPLDIDISQMSYGLHFLNFRTFNERGEAGPWKQILFYISNGIFDVEEIGYEYWIDDGEHVTGTGSMPSTLALPIDISGLKHGEHTFNFRGKNLYDNYGETFTTKFYVTVFGDVNDDGEVNPKDIVEVVNFIIGKPSDAFKNEAAELNDDSEINIADILKIVNIIMGY